MVSFPAAIGLQVQFPPMKHGGFETVKCPDKSAPPLPFLFVSFSFSCLSRDSASRHVLLWTWLRSSRVELHRCCTICLPSPESCRLSVQSSSEDLAGLSQTVGSLKCREPRMVFQQPSQARTVELWLCAGSLATPGGRLSTAVAECSPLGWRVPAGGTWAPWASRATTGRSWLPGRASRSAAASNSRTRQES